MIDELLNIGLIHYLVLAMILFIIGLLGVLISRNMLRTVMSLIVMSISVAITFITFGFYCDTTLEKANTANIFVLIITVVQTITAVVILYKIYQTNEYLDAEKIKDKED